MENIGAEILDVGAQLETLYTSLTSSSWDVADLEEQVGQRKADLTPIEGWDGKNADARAAHETRTYAEDFLLQQLLTSLKKAKLDRHYAEGNIKALEAKRRGLEWYVRFLGITDETSEN